MASFAPFKSSTTSLPRSPSNTSLADRHAIPEENSVLRARSTSPSSCPRAHHDRLPGEKDSIALSASVNPSATERQQFDARDNAAVPFSGTAAPTNNASGNTHGYAQHQDSGLSRPQPTTPEFVSSARYEYRHYFEPSLCWSNSIVKIPPMTSSFRHSDSESLWKYQEHPEGHVYFTKIIDNIRYHTDHWMVDSAASRDVDAFADMLRCELRISQGLPTDTEVVLHLCKDDRDETECFYYLVSETTRSVFWLDEVDSALISGNARPISDLPYLMNAIQSLYWQHVNLFPHGHFVSKELLDEVNETLNTLAVDVTTSDTSTSSWDYDVLQKISGAVRNIEVDAGAPSMWVLARTMSVLTWDRFVNMHGEREARLQRHRSTYEQSTREPSRLLRWVSPLFFNLPLQYLGELQKIWVDRSVNYQPWRAFINNLQKDWETSITPATVLLTANVGLLAIQSIDTNHSDRSMAQIASYISTFLSLGNIILCTILSREHRLDAHMTAESASNYLDGRANMPYGLEIVAISFSLPSVLFLWGMGAFYIAITWVCLAGTGLWTRLLSGSIFAIVSLCILLTVVFDLWSAQSLQARVPQLFDCLNNHRQTMRRALRSVVGAISVFGKTRRTLRCCTPRRRKRATMDEESQIPRN